MGGRHAVPVARAGQCPVASLVRSSAAGRSRQAPPPPPPAVTVAPVLQRDVAEWDEFSGRLAGGGSGGDPAPRVGLHQAGDVHRRAARSGKGEVLFEIDPRPYQADLDRAQAQLEQARTAAELAQREVARAEKLVNVQAISREEFDSRTSAQANSVAAVQAAEAAVETARLNLGWTAVRSPIAGRVSRAEVTEGNLVQAGPPDATLLTTVVSLDSMYLYFDSDEQTYLRYSGRGRRRARPRLARRALPGLPRAGQRDRIPARGASGLRGQPDRPGQRDHPHPRDLRQPRPPVHARAVRPGEAGGQQERPRRCWCATPPSAPTRTASSCWCSAKGDSLEYRPVEIGRLTDGLRIVRKGVKPARRSWSTGSCGCGRG